MSERTLDARGKPCPEPVVAARRILLEERPELLRVIVDNPASAENVSRMARSLGHAARIERQEPGEIHLLVSAGSGEGRAAPGGAGRDAAGEASSAAGGGSSPVAEAAADSCGRPSENVVLIGSAEFGAGDAELGGILMRAFVKTLGEVVPLPRAILFINGGVRLTVEGSALLDDLGELERRGARVLSCGTCLDFFHLKERLAVGRVTNMFEVVSLLSAADRVIRP